MHTHRRAVPFIASLLLAPIALAQAPANPSLHWWPPNQRESQTSYERLLNGFPDAASLRAFHDQTASEPHIAGTPGDQDNIRHLAATMKLMGLEMQVHEFWAYLAKPIDAKLAARWRML